MEHVKRLAQQTSQRLRTLVTSNAMVSKPISQGDRHVIPLCELGVAGRAPVQNRRARPRGVILST